MQYPIISIIDNKFKQNADFVSNSILNRNRNGKNHTKNYRPESLSQHLFWYVSFLFNELLQLYFLVILLFNED